MTMVAQLGELLKAYYEPHRKKILIKVRKEGFGWTPCEHYQQCIGWCPKCLELKNWALQTVRDFGEPQ
jgi:hypothetical protein